MVHIGPNEAHSLRAGDEGVRCFAFAVSFMKPGESYSVAEFQDWEMGHPDGRDGRNDMSGRVAGKAIIITGAGSGMGRAFALGLGA